MELTEQTQINERRIDETLVAIVAHPLRCQILEILDTRVASPKQMSDHLDADVGKVGYHTRCLEGLGAVELVDTKPRRGAVEHFYRAIKRPELDDAGIAAMSIDERTDFARFVFQLQTSDAAVALGERTLPKRPDSWFARVPAFVDEEGWAEMIELFTETYRRMYEILGASANRGNNKKIPVMTHLNFFETPPPMPLPDTSTQDRANAIS
jgi:hypothetical protein